MQQSKFLAFDFGAESGRAIIGILCDNKITLEEIHRFANKQLTIDGHVHWDIQHLLNELKKGLAIASSKGHSDILSIGIDTWGVDYGLIRNDNNLAELPYAYRDGRTDSKMEEVFEKIPRKEIYSKTGLQFMQFNTIYQLFSHNKTNPEKLKNCTLLFTPDLFNFFLTGERKSEYTIASTSQLLNAYTKKWDEDLFQSLGLPLQIMAPIIQPGTIVGKLLPEIAAEVNLNEIDVITPGGHDTAMAIAATPASGNNWAYLSSGTWSLIGIETYKPFINDITYENEFTNEGGVDNKICLLQNVMGLWLLQGLRKSLANQNSNFDYDQLCNQAEESEPFKYLFDASDNSFYNPPDMREAINNKLRNTKQSLPQTIGEYVRCILESLAFKYREVINKINNITGTEIERLHIIGGGSKNELLNQFTADACGIPVYAGPVEATALGNIMMQAISKGRIDSVSSGREIIRNSFPIKIYKPINSAVWNDTFLEKKNLL